MAARRIATKPAQYGDYVGFEVELPWLVGALQTNGDRQPPPSCLEFSGRDASLWKKNFRCRSYFEAGRPAFAFRRSEPTQGRTTLLSAPIVPHGEFSIK